MKDFYFYYDDVLYEMRRVWYEEIETYVYEQERGSPLHITYSTQKHMAQITYLLTYENEVI